MISRRLRGRIVDVETILEPDKTPRSPDPSSTSIQVTLDVILKQTCSITERVYTHDEYTTTHLMQTTHRNTDEYVDPDMFGASARPKSNPAPRFKTSPNFDENADIYDDQMFGFGKYVHQHYQGPQTDDTRDHMQYPPTNRAERNPRQPRYISLYRTQTSRRGNHQRPDETRRRITNTQSRYVNLDKFDGKVGEWDNWYHKFEFHATHNIWDDRERLVRLVSCLKGPALTAHRSFSQTARNTYAHCIAALQERYGSRRPALIITLRAELSTVRHEEGESMETFGDRVYTLTNQAYPFLVNEPTLLQSLAVPAFLKGLRDRNAAQEAMMFRDPKSIQETITHIQGASCIFGNRGAPTVRHVSFGDKPITEAAPSTDMDLLQGVDRQLQQYAVTRKVTPTSDACYTCGGSGHRSLECATRNRATFICYHCGGIGHYLFECSNRPRCTSSRKRSRGKRSAFLSLQRVRRNTPPRPVRSDAGPDQRTHTSSDVATVDVRGDIYSVQLAFEGRAPMAISSDSRDFDCDRTNVESFSGCPVSISKYATNSHRETPASRLPTIYPVVTVAIYPAVTIAIVPVITGTTFPVSTGAIFPNIDPVITGTTYPVVPVTRLQQQVTSVTSCCYIVNIKRH